MTVNLTPIRSSTLVAIALAAVLAGPVSAQGAETGAPGAETGAPATGTRDAGTGIALLDALARVPDVPAAREPMLTYVDIRAVEAARPGAAHPGSFAELQALLEARDPSGDLWFAATMGVVPGSADFWTQLSQAGDWPELVGFDFFDIDQVLVFGAPPGYGTVLLGEFEPDAIGSAFEARGYTAKEAGTRTLLCGEVGCDGGLEMDLSKADAALPFGGRLGRSEPLAVSEGELLGSADFMTLQGMLAAADGEVPSLADDPAFRAIAGAPLDEAGLIQATILPGGMLGLGPGIYADVTSSPEEATALLAELDETFEPMPAADVVAVLDGATATEQVVTIALTYADEADAAVAADVLPRRLATLHSLVVDAALAELLADKGVTSVTGQVEPGDDDTSAVAVVELRAPLAGGEPDPESGRLETPSGVYRFIVQMLMIRDTLWLAPVLPLE